MLALLAACASTSARPAATPTGPSAAAPEHPAAATPRAATLTARQAFENPGGMWMPEQMAHPAHAAQLSALGVTIPAEQLTDPLAAPLGAVVSLGGCTASFVSPDGLVVTNHHCVQGALQVNSTPERNLVQEGFLARTRADELSAGPTQKVMVAQRITDVTREVSDGLDQIADPGEREATLERRQKQVVAACEQGRPGVRCAVSDFFSGAEYRLIEYLEIRDVRLVYVPARAIGNYGGEIDNWAWPRHTGDFSFYRAYVGKDGKPADFSPDNVPYRPAHWLKVAPQGVSTHDFVMVTGYPGSTNRLTTFADVQFEARWRLPYVIEYLQQRYALAADLMKLGGETKIKAGVIKQGVQNGLEKYQGVLAGLVEGDILARKQAIDARVRAWVAQPGREAYAQAITALDALMEETQRTAQADLEFNIAIGSSAHLRNALLFVRLAEERTKPDIERKPGYQDRDLPRRVDSQKQFARVFDPAIDRAQFRLALLRAAKLPPGDRPWLAAIVGGKKGAAINEAAIDRALDALYRDTKLDDEALRLTLLTKADRKTLEASKDPFIKLALALWPTVKAKEAEEDRLAGRALVLAPKYALAMREALGGFLAPDANSTLRITYGTVKPLGGKGEAFTRASQIPRKDTGEEPFDAPRRLLDAIAAENWGPYASPELGEVPVDFAADCDITGGNSGSPVLDADGRLVGLAFDINIEGVASDVVFDHATTRTIIVDVRYMLWVMDLVDGADNVLAELGISPSL